MLYHLLARITSRRKHPVKVPDEILGLDLGMCEILGISRCAFLHYIGHVDLTRFRRDPALGCSFNFGSTVKLWCCSLSSLQTRLDRAGNAILFFQQIAHQKAVFEPLILDAGEHDKGLCLRPRQSLCLLADSEALPTRII